MATGMGKSPAFLARLETAGPGPSLLAAAASTRAAISSSFSIRLRTSRALSPSQIFHDQEAHEIANDAARAQHRNREKCDAHHSTPPRGVKSSPPRPGRPHDSAYRVGKLL